MHCITKKRQRKLFLSDIHILVDVLVLSKHRSCCSNMHLSSTRTDVIREIRTCRLIILVGMPLLVAPISYMPIMYILCFCINTFLEISFLLISFGSAAIYTGLWKVGEKYLFSAVRG